MFTVIISVLIFNLSWVAISAGPVSIQKCKGKDAACILQSAKALQPAFVKGIPEYKIPSLDTVEVPFIDASTPDLKLLLNDLKFKGIDKCEILDTRRDVEKQKLYVQVLCNVKAEGIYDMKGKLLILPIEGNGKLTIDIKKVLVNIDADIFAKKGKDGKDHWSIKEWKYTYDLQEKSKIHFESLLPGNKEVAKAAEDVISENGNEIIAEVGTPVIKVLFGKVIENVAKLLKAVPEEDLAISD